ncbi:CinA family protein [Bradyrhizobium neotropicale]|uniref:CinA family protein n=1 Tax=Bradyrhizobium neotropicale TaxID=1497615 RepID=UPI000B0B3DD4|nr:CinA family protein [Bradyrhizobium neotropicale]
MKELVGIAEQVAAKLIARKETIAVAESSAGGLIAASLLAVPGASAYFLGGAVVYTRDARRVLMDISDDGMKGFRSSSEPYAKLLAEQMRGRFGCDWGLSETGAAGPSGNRYGDAAGQLHGGRRTRGGGHDAGDRQQGSTREHADVCGNGAEAAAEEFGAVICIAAQVNRDNHPAYTTVMLQLAAFAEASAAEHPCGPA